METTLELLKESGALLEGHFLLSSGRHSDRYFQCARLFTRPDRAALAIAPLAARLREEIDSGRLAIDLLVGPAMGGIIHAYELGRQLGLPAMFTERDETGAMTLRRGFEVPRGARVAIVEDVVTTGKSSRESAAAIEAAGGSVVALACVVDRRAGGEKIDWPIFAATTLPTESWLPENCPLCAKGLAYVKPGSRKAP